MEMVLILAAVAALAVSGVMVAAMGARSRRPPLRLPHERSIERANQDGLMEDLERPLPSPIDRTGAVLDLDPIERHKEIEGPERIEAAGSRDGGGQPEEPEETGPRHRGGKDNRGGKER